MKVGTMNTIVIAHHNEPIEWIADLPTDMTVYLYNAGPEVTNSAVLDRIDFIIPVPTAGASYAFLSHLLGKQVEDDGFTIFVDATKISNSEHLLAQINNADTWEDIQTLDTGSTGARQPAAFYLATLQDAVGQGSDLAQWYRSQHPDMNVEQGIVADFLARFDVSLSKGLHAGSNEGAYAAGGSFAIRNRLIDKAKASDFDALAEALEAQPNYAGIVDRLWLHLFGLPFRVQMAAIAEPVREEVSYFASSKPTETAAPAAPSTAMQFAQLEEQIAAQANLLLNLSREVVGLKAIVSGLSRPKRLFISTGYFATAIAATLTRQLPGYDDYLMIIADRQSDAENLRFAYRMNETWKDVKLATHQDYYLEPYSFRSPFGVTFDEVFSPHIPHFGHVERIFPAPRYRFFEEGLNTYHYVRTLRSAPADLPIYALQPVLLKGAQGLPLQIDRALFKATVARDLDYAEVPQFEGDRNIILLAIGLPPEMASQRPVSFSVFETMADALREAGYQLWLKPHPRVAIDDLFAGSQLEAKGVRLLRSASPLVETLILKNQDRVAAVISSYTSFLVYCQSLFGIPAYSVASPMPSQQQADFKALQDTAVADVQQFLHGLGGSYRSNEVANTGAPYSSPIRQQK